jgi:VanZ family protein
MIWSRFGFALVLIAITIGSLLPSNAVGPAGQLPDWLRHGFGYFLLGLFAALAFRASPRWAIFLGVLIYGAMIEVLQPIVADRDFELTDLAANAVGAALGIAVASLTTYRSRSPRQ